MLNNLRLNPSYVFNNDSKGEGLRKTAVRGSLALMLSQGMSFALSMVNTIVLARLLTPSDFGLIGMVTVFINFLIMFKDAGLSTATIQKEEINSQQISTLFWIMEKKSEVGLELNYNREKLCIGLKKIL